MSVNILKSDLENGSLPDSWYAKNQFTLSLPHISFTYFSKVGRNILDVQNYTKKKQRDKNRMQSHQTFMLLMSYISDNEKFL